MPPHALPTRHGFDEWEGVPYSNDMNWVGEPDFDALVKMSISGDAERRAAALARRGAKYAKPMAAHHEAPLFFSQVTPDGVIDTVEKATDQRKPTDPTCHRARRRLYSAQRGQTVLSVHAVFHASYTAVS